MNRMILACRTICFSEMILDSYMFFSLVFLPDPLAKTPEKRNLPL